ncbi:Metallo-dependent phosphatase-like protein [Aspergillus oleicola]
MSTGEQPRKITLAGHRLRTWAQYLLDLHLRLAPAATTPETKATENKIRIVCISDTHNNQPSLPSGDVLIHAGDLTETGSFDELQDQITWLDSQPHRHKIVIAGNHDVLLDESFLEKYPERRYGDSRTREELNWGNVIYLENKDITVKVEAQGTGDPNNNTNTNENDNNSSSSKPQLQQKPSARILKIFGSPLTPQYTLSAFQYPSHLSRSTWTNKIPCNIDILITHGPPRLYLDFDPNNQGGGLRHTGDPYLTAEIGRVRPRLVVFGHIHVGYGREDLVLDFVRRGFEDVQNRLGEWGVLMGMVVGVFWGVLRRVAGFKGDGRVTTFVNAAIVGGGLANEVRNGAFVVDI